MADACAGPPNGPLADGDVLVVGQLADAADFGTGPGMITLVNANTTGTGGIDGFVARYAADGFAAGAMMPVYGMAER